MNFEVRALRAVGREGADTIIFPHSNPPSNPITLPRRPIAHFSSIHPALRNDVILVAPKSFTSIDGFAIVGSVVYFFQMTINDDHTVKEAGVVKVIDVLREKLDAITFLALEYKFVWVVDALATGEKLCSKLKFVGDEWSLKSRGETFRLRVGYLTVDELAMEFLAAGAKGVTG